MRHCTACGEQLVSPSQAYCTACSAPVADVSGVLAQAMLGRRATAINLNIEAVRMLRQIDAEEHAAALAGHAGHAASAAEAAAEVLGPLEEAVSRAIRAARAAETRARAARDFADECAAVSRRAQRQHRSAGEQTDALLRARAAKTVASGEEAAREGAAAALASAEAQLAGARGQAEGLEAAAQTARAAADAPPQEVPLSVWTATLGHPLILLGHENLTGEERGLVAVQAAAVAELSGEADNLRAEGAAVARSEVEAVLKTSPVVAVDQHGNAAAIWPQGTGPAGRS